MSLLPSLARAANWLWAGYPTEAPEGHIALIALMSSKAAGAEAGLACSDGTSRPRIPRT
jgi:hypothetical protein